MSGFSSFAKDGGPYLEHRMAGVHTVAIQGLNTGTLDLANNGWGHQVGLLGEKLQIYSEQGYSTVQWTQPVGNTPIAWYKVCVNKTSTIIDQLEVTNKPHYPLLPMNTEILRYSLRQ